MHSDVVCEDKYMALTVQCVTGVKSLWFARGFNVECNVKNEW